MISPGFAFARAISSEKLFNPAVGPTTRTYGWPTSAAISANAATLTELEVADKMCAPMLGLYGGADAGICNLSVDNLRRALQAAGNTRSEIIIYAITPHAFHADYRPTYRKTEAADGWRRPQDWFRKFL